MNWPNWGTWASVVAVAGFVGAGGLYGYNAIRAIETDEDVDKKLTVLKVEVLKEIAKVREEEDRRAVGEGRSSAWNMVQLKKMEALVLRNRVNDCRDNPPKTNREKRSCEQYETEYASAFTAYNAAVSEAQLLSKPK